MSGWMEKLLIQEEEKEDFLRCQWRNERAIRSELALKHAQFSWTNSLTLLSSLVPTRCCDRSSPRIQRRSRSATLLQTEEDIVYQLFLIEGWRRTFPESQSLKDKRSSKGQEKKSPSLKETGKKNKPLLRCDIFLVFLSVQSLFAFDLSLFMAFLLCWMMKHLSANFSFEVYDSKDTTDSSAEFESTNKKRKRNYYRPTS